MSDNKMRFVAGIIIGLLTTIAGLLSAIFIAISEGVGPAITVALVVFLSLCTGLFVVWGE
jgi:hypothetical protein